MADHFGGVLFSSPSKRLKLNMHSYAVAFGDSTNGSGVVEESDNRMLVVDDETDDRQLRRLPNTSPGSDFDGDVNCVAVSAAVENSRVCIGVTSSSDRLLIGDIHEGCLSNGGDSGFNDITSPSSTGDAEASGTDLDEPDSSTMCGFSNVKSAAGALKEEVVDHEVDDEEDDDEVASTISHLSGLSDLTDMSGQDWKPIAGPMSWVHRQMISGISPRILLQQILPRNTHIPDQVDDVSLWKLIINIMNEPPRRKRLQNVNTLDDALNRILSSCKIMVLTGAGVSVSCGIPDFRSRDGIYARLAKDFPDLPDPQAMFSIQYFRKDPRPFYKFAKEIYPGLFQPSPCHRFIKLLEDKGKLIRNYTQNIDTLEQVAGIQRIIECHGSFATASCLRCKYKVDSSAIRDDIFDQTIPRCPRCTPGTDELAIMKPDIVFFGEGLSDEFHHAMNTDKDQCDLLIVIGSSLKVRPVALIPSSVPESVPQILINRERLPHMNFDVELLGDCDIIINELCRRLGNGWNHLCYSDVALTEITDIPNKELLNYSSATDIAEVSSEHSNDPCDSTSFPHRNMKQKDDNDVTEETCHNGLPSMIIDVVSAGGETANPDSTNVGHDFCTIPRRSASPCTSMSILECNSESTLKYSNGTSKPKSLSALSANSYLFCPPNRYVFCGAEVYDIGNDTDSDIDNNRDSDDSSSSSGTSVEDETVDVGNASNMDEDDNSIFLSRSSESGFLPRVHQFEEES